MINALGQSWRLRALLVAAFAVLALAVLAPTGAWASHDCDDPATTGVVESCTEVQEANNAVSGGVSDATSIITTNIPLVLGVTVAFVALRFGKRLLGKIG